MKRFFFLSLITIIALPFACRANYLFNEYFTDNTLRMDYYHTGDAVSDSISVDKFYKYNKWAGSKLLLIDKFNNGAYYAKVYAKDSEELLYSKGFDNYFREYQTTREARDGKVKSYHETFLMPYPKGEVIIAIEKRQDNNSLEEIFRYEFDPKQAAVEKFKKDPAVKIFNNARINSHNKVEIAVIGEGYSEKDTDKFEKDFGRLRNIFFTQEPYRSHKNNFHFYGVLKASEDSGVDEPRAGIFRNTAVNATFNSLGSERYLLTEDNKALRDIAGHVPYDAVMIMVNSSRYGGGGIYNFYCTFTSDNQWFGYLVLHEFGHSFAGLADEYYTSSTAYGDFYSIGREPVEPNITAETDESNIKWFDLLSNGLDVPTPWEKAEFDILSFRWQRERRQLNNRIAKLKKEKANATLIEAAEKEYADKDREQANKTDAYLEKCKDYGKIGVFEGAGYASEGLYRPMLDCIMFSKGKKPYCKVCENHILKVIRYHIGAM